MNRIVITIEGGVIQNVVTTEPTEVVVVDYDTDGCDASQIVDIYDDKAVLGLMTAEVLEHDVNTAFEAQIKQASEAEEDDRIYNPELSEELADCMQPDCDECETDNITLTGFYSEDDYGMFVEFICNDCKLKDMSGDGEFKLYYSILPDGSIEHKTNAEIEAQFVAGGKYEGYHCGQGGNH